MCTEDGERRGPYSIFFLNVSFCKFEKHLSFQVHCAAVLDPLGEWKEE